MPRRTQALGWRYDLQSAGQFEAGSIGQTLAASQAGAYLRLDGTDGGRC